ncbi:MAG: flagellar basal body P-ring formation chaperone FlgA [Holophagales bacterium]|jgi:flagella basal body P-ring formation protein FlgA|nr:flagellar basal body P-ring formation chaperone FlgA [Holophagales bacterium]
MRTFLICLISLLLPVASLWARNDGHTELLSAKAIAFAENAAGNFPGQYAIQVARSPKLPPLKPGKVTFDADRMSKQEPLGRFFVVFRVYVDGILAATTRVEMQGTWSGSLYQAKAALPRKTVITESELEAIAFEGVPPAGAMKELSKDIRLRQPMPIGKILTQMDIEPIPLINAADRVRVTLKNGALNITSEAVAKSNGSIGDRVRLEMDGSKKLVQAVVTGPCEAVIDVRGSKGLQN